MTRDEIVSWLEAHRESVHGEPAEALGRAERAARRRAAEEAWRHAARIAEQQVARWRDRSTGLHARETFVARELCHELARDLRHLEPHPDPIPEAELGDFERDARDRLRAWLEQVAGEEEHRVWQEACRYTDARARALIREGQVSDEDRWELMHSYAETAARLAALLAQEFEARAEGA